MDRRQLRYFLAVAEAGSLTYAADELRVAQPTLSQAIASLERDVGMPLFERLGRGVRLTSAGEQLVEPAGQVLRDFSVAEESMSAVRGLTGGRLDVATLPTLVQTVATLVGDFAARYPDVSVRVPELAAGDSVERAVAAGTTELGLTELPCDQADLVALPMGRQDFHLVLPPGTSAPALFPLARLAGLRLVATPPGTSSRAHLDEALARTPASSRRIVVETGQREALVPLVLAGAGAALLPDPLAADARRLGAVVRPTTPRIRRTYGLVHRRGPRSPAAQAFTALALGADLDAG